MEAVYQCRNCKSWLNEEAAHSGGHWNDPTENKARLKPCNGLTVKYDAKPADVDFDNVVDKIAQKMVYDGWWHRENMSTIKGYVEGVLLARQMI